MKASAARRESQEATARVNDEPSAAPSSSRRAARSAAAVEPPTPAARVASKGAQPEEASPHAPPSYEKLEESDVFVCKTASDPKAARAAREVTLFVHGWHNVEPGLLSWTFPSLRSALDAVQRMKNAIGWCVVSGTGWTDLDSARASGAVLVEQLS